MDKREARKEDNSKSGIRGTLCGFGGSVGQRLRSPGHGAQWIRVSIAQAASQQASAGRMERSRGSGVQLPGSQNF